MFSVTCVSATWGQDDCLFERGGHLIIVTAAVDRSHCTFGSCVHRGVCYGKTLAAAAAAVSQTHCRSRAPQRLQGYDIAHSVCLTLVT